MGDTLAEEVAAAATRTMRGSVRVQIQVQMSVPDFEGLFEYAGPVDFDSDRCRLDGERHAADEATPVSIVLDGAAPIPGTLTPDLDRFGDRGRIDLPPAELTISLAAKIEQDYNEGRLSTQRDTWVTSGSSRGCFMNAGLSAGALEEPGHGSELRGCRP